MDRDDVVIAVDDFLSIHETIHVGYTCRRLTRLCAELLESKFSHWEQRCSAELAPHVDLCDARMENLRAEKEHRMAQDLVVVELRREITILEDDNYNDGDENTNHQLLLHRRKRELLEVMEGQTRSLRLWNAQCEAWFKVRDAMEKKFAEKKQTSEFVMAFVTFALNISLKGEAI